MNRASMSSDEKFGHYAIGALLILLGTPILALGLYGVYFALTDPYSAAPGLGPTAIFVAMIGGIAIGVAIAAIRHARRTPLRPY